MNDFYISILTGNEPYNENQPTYVPFGLVNCVSNNNHTIYHCYLMELNPNFSYDISIQDIFLATRIKLDPEIGFTQFDMGFDRGSLSVKLCYKGTINLSPDQVCCLVVLQLNLTYLQVLRKISVFIVCICFPGSFM